MCSMEVTGDGYKTIGYATECAKIVTKCELDEDWNLEHLFGERSWIEMLKEEIFEEPDEDSFLAHQKTRIREAMENQEKRILTR